MDETLLFAIAHRRRLRLLYHGKERLVEPQCYGLGRKGHDLLRVHQLHGGAQREPLFRVTEMQNLQMLEETFLRPGPHYRPGDSAMKVIYAEL